MFQGRLKYVALNENISEIPQPEISLYSIDFSFFFRFPRKWLLRFFCYILKALQLLNEYFVLGNLLG